MKTNDSYVAFGDALKATRDGNRGIVEAVGVRFTGPNDRDLDGEYFTAETDYGPHKGDGMAATLNHRMPMVTRSTKSEELPVLESYAKRIFSQPVKAEMTPQGIIAQHILDLADDYEKMIFDMAQKGKLRWSSGAPGHMVDKDESKRITTWHIAEWAYTPIAADPNLPTIAPVKSLANIELSEPEEATEQSQPAAETPADDIAVSTDDDEDAQEPSAEEPAPGAQSAEPTPEPEDEIDAFYEIIGDFIDIISERIGRKLS